MEEVENDPETNEPLYEKVKKSSNRIIVYTHTYTHIHEETTSIYSIDLSIHLHIFDPETNEPLYEKVKNKFKSNYRVYTHTHTQRDHVYPSIYRSIYTLI